jgi:hypothetical protein
VEAIEPSVEQVIGLGSDLVNSVNVDRAQWVAFIDRQVFWPPVLLSRCREDDLRAWRMLAAGSRSPSWATFIIRSAYGSHMLWTWLTCQPG